MDVQEGGSQQLIAPLQFFVEVQTYAQMKGTPPSNEQIVYRKFQGQVLAGVVVAGHAWMMGWEDGMKGIYKVEDSSYINITKNVEALSSDEPALCDNLVADTQNHYLKQLLNPQQRAFTDPNAARAASLLCLGGFTEESETSSSSMATPASKAIAPGTSASAELPATAMITYNAPDIDDCSISSIMDMIRPQPCEVIPIPKAKPSAKKKRSSAKALPQVPEFDACMGLGRDVKIEEVAHVEEPQPKNPRRGGTSPKPKPKSTIEVVEPVLSSNMAAHMSEGDKTWFSSTKASLMECCVFEPREPDNEFKADIIEHQKKVQGVLGTVTKRKRTLKRRTPENAEAALEQATEIEDVASTLLALLKSLGNVMKGNPGSGDECSIKINALEGMDSLTFKFGAEIFKKIARQMLFDVIKMQQWHTIHSSVLPMLSEHIGDDVTKAFLAQQMNVLLQKLLKGISIDKAGIIIISGEVKEV